MSFATHDFDGPLGCFRLIEHRPAGLGGIVGPLWYFEGQTRFRRERAMPNGILEIIVHLGARYRLVEGVGPELCPTACIGGMYTRPIVIEAPDHPTRMLGIRLYPAGAYALLERPVSEISGLTVDLQDLLGLGSAELVERCCSAMTGEECLLRAVRWISERAGLSRRADSAVLWAAAAIESSGGTASIAALREHIGWSKTRFVSAFREQIGAPPKLYARILRFRHALTLLDGGPLADVALEAGYYDQPHLCAEFRELSGFSPREYLAARRYDGSPNLAEAA